MKWRFLLILALACAPAAAMGSQPTCSVTAIPVHFGSAAGSGTYDANGGTITVSCTNNASSTVTACIKLGQGSFDSSGNHLISDGRATIPVAFYQDAGLSRPWGTAAGGQVRSVTITGNNGVDTTVYARASVPSTPHAGAYQSVFQITVNYGVSMDCSIMR